MYYAEVNIVRHSIEKYSIAFIFSVKTDNHDTF